MYQKSDEMVKKNISVENADTNGKEIQTQYSMNKMAVIVAAAVAVRLLITLIPSYVVDMGGYKAWSMYLASNGSGGLYNTFHIVYAPGYMYLLWFSGIISSVFSLGAGVHEYLIKLWSVAADLIGGYLIYLIGRNYGKQKMGFILGIVYTLNPGVFFNSSIWGQFDSIPATLLLGVVYCFNFKKKVAAVILFTAAILTKPQSGLLAPLVLILFFKGFSVRDLKAWKQLLLAFIGCFCTYVFAVVPFYFPTPFLAGVDTSGIRGIFYQTADLFYWMIHLYQSSLGDYPYATANAFNLWTLLGGQPVFDNTPFLGLTFATWGILLLAAVIILSAWLLFKRKKSALALYFSTFFILSGSFMFVTRMHERYLLPCLIFLTVCILWDKNLWLPTALLSLCVAANHCYLYYLSWKEVFWLDNYNPVAMAFSAVTICTMAYMVYYLICLMRSKKATSTDNSKKNDRMESDTAECIPDKGTDSHI